MGEAELSTLLGPAVGKNKAADKAPYTSWAMLSAGSIGHRENGYAKETLWVLEKTVQGVRNDNTMQEYTNLLELAFGARDSFDIIC